MQKIILKQSDKKILVQHSENQKPNEACAILFGKENKVEEVFLTKNIDDSGRKTRAEVVGFTRIVEIFLALGIVPEDPS